MIATFAVPILIPFSAPVSLGLTTFMAVLPSSSRIITKKINKHAAIGLLEKSKLDSIEEKCYKAIRDGKITDEEFYDMEQEIKKYEKMKTFILKNTIRMQRNHQKLEKS